VISNDMLWRACGWDETHIEKTMTLVGICAHSLWKQETSRP